MVQTSCLLLVLAAVCSTVSGTSVRNYIPESHDYYDLVQGEVNPHNILIFNGPFNGDDFEWIGANWISRFEVRNRNGNDSNLLASLLIGGGVNSHFLHLQSPAGPINADVRIYSKPNNQTLGWKSSGNVLLNTTRISGLAPENLQLELNETVRYVEFVDLTNGTGSFVIADGIDSTRLNIRFRSHLFRGPFEYRINIFGEREQIANNYETGNLTNSSILLTTEVITNSDLTWYGTFIWQSPNSTFDFARLTDLSGGSGGRVLFARILDNQTVEFYFERTDPIVFLLEVYGQPVTQPDLAIGELQVGSVLLHEEVVNEVARAKTVVFFTQDPIDRIEVWNLAESANGTVQADLIAGELGEKLVVVQLVATDPPQLIHFAVRAFGRRQSG